MTDRTSPAAKRDADFAFNHADPGISHRTAAGHDDQPAITHYPVCDMEGLAKAIIRQAPDKVHRWLMWEAFQSAMEGAAESSREYPWDDPGSVTVLTPESAKAALLRMFAAIPDDGERDRLAKVAAKEAEILEDRLASGTCDTAVPDGKHPVRHCSQCGKPYRPQRESARTCSPACRTGV